MICRKINSIKFSLTNMGCKENKTAVSTTCHGVELTALGILHTQTQQVINRCHILSAENAY